MDQFSNGDRRKLGFVLTIEKWIAILGMLLLGVATWVATEMIDLGREQSQIRPMIETLSSEVTIMRRKLDKLYTTEDARRDFEVRDAILADHAERIRSLEKRRASGPPGDPR